MITLVFGLTLLVGMDALIKLLIGVLIACILLGAFYWVISTLVPEPLRKYAIAVLVVIAAIVLVYFLMDLYQGGGVLGK
jgi:hypothetical protein